MKRVTHQNPNRWPRATTPILRISHIHSLHTMRTTPATSSTHATWFALRAQLALLGCVLLAVCLLIATQALLAPQALAAPTSLLHDTAIAHQRATQAQQDQGGQVTVIVLDMSGSMSTNDPAGLRCSAANAYISLSGMGDSIGVIGLDNSSGARGGPHNFETAQVWAPPIDMSTLAARNGLINSIATKSNNCSPDASTPTYDALNQALSMLASATNGNGRTGSVILLTDGVPDPDTQSQLSAIQSELLPKFQADSFPIDSIALGADQSSHPFLRALSNATSGNFYDDSNGPVQGAPDALNIAPFFVDIFALRNHRTPGPTVAPTNLSGGLVSQDLSVPSYVAHLDVIVVKDTPSTSVSLTSPLGQSLPPAVAGALVATDPHYAIFSIDGGQVGVEAGQWQVNVTGSGRFLVDSLFKSSLVLAITSPDASVADLPLGQNFTVAATLSSHGIRVVGQYTVSGVITSANPSAGGAPFAEEVTLAQASPGLYQDTLNIPQSAPSGAYTITINVTQISGTPISSIARTIRLELFPTPVFLSIQSATPTTATVDTTVTQWDPALQALYSLPVVSWFSGWPLDWLPARPTVTLPGEVTLNNQLYSQATVNGVATRNGSTQSTPIQVVNTGGGHFTVHFAAPVTGVYTIVFKTSGKFSDSYGDFGTTTRTAQLTVIPATLKQEVIAWLITLLAYPILLWLIYFIFLGRWLTPAPNGKWIVTPKDSTVGVSTPGDFRRAHSDNPLRGFLHRNWRTTHEAFGDDRGALLVFGRGSVHARQVGNSKGWKLPNGEDLPRDLVGVAGLSNDNYDYTFQMRHSSTDGESSRRRSRNTRRQDSQAAADGYDSGEDGDARRGPNRQRGRTRSRNRHQNADNDY